MLHDTPRLRPTGRTSPVLFCLLFAALALPALATRVTSPSPGLSAYDCEGAACAAVTLTWEEEGQRFRVDNSSAQRVRVKVETFAGESSVTVEPQASAHLSVKTFNGPYHAEYE